MSCELSAGRSGQTRARLQSAAVSGWVFLVTSAQLSLAIPYIHWYGSAVLVAVLGFSFRRVRWGDLRFALVASSILLLAVCTAALASEDPAYQLIEAGKLGIILLMILPLLTNGSTTTTAAIRGAEMAVCVNVGLAAAGSLGFTLLGGMITPGRFGTVLNWPGALWRVGILTIAGSGLRFFSGHAGLRDLLVFFASTLLIVLDGSRTAYLIVLAGALALVSTLFRTAAFHARRGGASVVLRCVLVATMVLAAFAITDSFIPSDEVGFIERGWNMLRTMTTDRGSLDDLDETRGEMASVAADAILDHPVLGSGMGTTTSSSPAGPMVVHIAYLQLWADVGMLAFLSFSALIVGSIPILWMKYKLTATAEAKRAALFYNGIFLLACWAVAALFHPMSTEISDWIMFVLGYSCVVGSGDARTALSSVASPSASASLSLRAGNGRRVTAPHI